MKLSRTAWLILGIGIFVIVFISLYVVFLQQGREQQRLYDSLSLAQATLPDLVSDREGLESQLTQLESELTQADSLLDEAEAKFPESAEIIEYGEKLFKIADSCDLEIATLTAEEPRDKEVESEPTDEETRAVTYSTTSFTVEVEGTVAHILKFINTIATSEYSPNETNFINATIERVNMEVPEPGGEEEPKATIDLIIYGYEGE